MHLARVVNGVISEDRYDVWVRCIGCICFIVSHCRRF